MRAIQKSLLIASLVATGASATSLVNLVDTNVKAEVNAQLNHATVTITVAKAQLYDKNGMPIAKGLTYGTSWKVDQQTSTAIGNLYRVATGEYVKPSDVKLLINTPGIAENNNQGMGQILMHNYNLKIVAMNAHFMI
jgi:hypothetical protein